MGAEVVRQITSAPPPPPPAWISASLAVGGGVEVWVMPKA